MDVRTSTWFILWVLYAPIYVLQDIFDHSKEATDEKGTKVVIWIVVCVVPYALLSALLTILLKIRSIHRQLVPLFHFDVLKLAGIETTASAAEKSPLLTGAPQWWGVKPQEPLDSLPRTLPKPKRSSFYASIPEEGSPKAGMQALDEKTCDQIEQHVKAQTMACHSRRESIPFLSSPSPAAPNYTWLRWFMGLGGQSKTNNLFIGLECAQGC